VSQRMYIYAPDSDTAEQAVAADRAKPRSS
jgi:hypothetical protein